MYAAYWPATQQPDNRYWFMYVSCIYTAEVLHYKILDSRKSSSSLYWYKIILWITTVIHICNSTLTLNHVFHVYLLDHIVTHRNAVTCTVLFIHCTCIHRKSCYKSVSLVLTHCIDSGSHSDSPYRRGLVLWVSVFLVNPNVDPFYWYRNSDNDSLSDSLC